MSSQEGDTGFVYKDPVGPDDDGGDDNDEDDDIFSERTSSQHSSSWNSFLKSSRSQQKEKKYRSRFTNLLRDNAGIYSGSNKNGISKEEEEEEYQAETKLMKSILEAERNSWITGGIIALSTFFSVRYLPTYMVKKFGGEAKAIALREAEVASRNEKFWFLHYTVALSLQIGLGAWAGLKGYGMASRGKNDVYEDIARIPLVEGRSFISDTLCEKWIDTCRTIPPEFWTCEGEEEWHDKRTWHAIRSFAINCLKRKTYERKLRNEIAVEVGVGNAREENRFSYNSSEDVSEDGTDLIYEHMAIPSPGVPEIMSIEESVVVGGVQLLQRSDGDVDVDDKKMLLSKTEAERLVEDAKL